MVGKCDVPGSFQGGLWRRDWDSNPGYSLKYTRFPSVRLKPLGHLSGGGLLLEFTIAERWIKSVRAESGAETGFQTGISEIVYFTLPRGL
jgi:hypothetical protein